MASPATGELTKEWRERVDWEQAIFLLGLGVLVLAPGYWLFRDARRRGKNGLVWVTLYAFAVVPPTRMRFIFVPLVFAAWFLLREQRFPLLRRIVRLLSSPWRKPRSR